MAFIEGSRIWCYLVSDTGDTPPPPPIMTLFAAAAPPTEGSEADLHASRRPSEARWFRTTMVSLKKGLLYCAYSRSTHRLSLRHEITFLAGKIRTRVECSILFLNSTSCPLGRLAVDCACVPALAPFYWLGGGGGGWSAQDKQLPPVNPNIQLAPNLFVTSPSPPPPLPPSSMGNSKCVQYKQYS